MIFLVPFVCIVILDVEIGLLIGVVFSLIITVVIKSQRNKIDVLGIKTDVLWRDQSGETADISKVRETKDSRAKWVRLTDPERIACTRSMRCRPTQNRRINVSHTLLRSIVTLFEFCLKIYPVFLDCFLDVWDRALALYRVARSHRKRAPYTNVWTGWCFPDQLFWRKNYPPFTKQITFFCDLLISEVLFSRRMRWMESAYFGWMYHCTSPIQRSILVGCWKWLSHHRYGSRRGNTWFQMETVTTMRVSDWRCRQHGWRLLLLATRLAWR